jgi:NO-binding membrane sensor protein with MHYT domain
VAEVHHFAYGPISAVLAYVLSFLGSLLGLVFTARSRAAVGASRARWLSLAAVAIGSTGIWLMHFMAMLGFDVPATTVRYDVALTCVSLAIAVLIVGVGLFIVGFGRPTTTRIVLGGVLTGLGVAAMHYTGMAAMHVGGRIEYDAPRVVLSVGIAVIAAIVALWFAVVVRGSSATVLAALIMAVAVCSMHYTGMSALRVTLGGPSGQVHGARPTMLLVPIFVMTAVVISSLAYSTVGVSIHRDSARAEATLAHRRRVFATHSTERGTIRR